MQRTYRIALTLILAAAAGWAAAAQGRASFTLSDVVKQLDEQSKTFRSLTASMERTKVTVVVNDRSTETGLILVRRDSKMRLEMLQPDARTILLNGNDLYLYTPRIKRVEEYDLGKHRTLVDQFLLLGFGTSGKDLEKGYLMTVLGEQSLSSKRVIQLELTPKTEEVRNQISRIHLWIDMATWLPVQQKFFETGSGDYFEIRYTNIVRNPNLPDSRFRPNWPRDVERIKRR